MPTVLQRASRLAMSRSLTLTFPGDPKPAPRPRFGQGVTYMPKNYTAYKEALAWAFKAKIKKPMEGSIIIVLDFYRRTRGKVDVDNLAKTVMDAGNGVAWVDDSQIVELHSSKFLGCANPCTEIRLEEL